MSLKSVFASFYDAELPLEVINISPVTNDLVFPLPGMSSVDGRWEGRLSRSAGRLGGPLDFPWAGSGVYVWAARR